MQHQPELRQISRRHFMRGLLCVAAALPLVQACSAPAPSAPTSAPAAAHPAAPKPTTAPAAAPTSAPAAATPTTAAKPATAARRGGEVRFALNNEPPDFDPHATPQASAHTVLMN